jgi:hypothetical protein
LFFLLDSSTCFILLLPPQHHRIPQPLKETILVYTGLSSVTFFTVLALFLAVSYVIST